MRRPGIEPGASRWQRDILPLNQRRSHTRNINHAKSQTHTLCIANRTHPLQRCLLQAPLLSSNHRHSTITNHKTSRNSPLSVDYQSTVSLLPAFYLSTTSVLPVSQPVIIQMIDASELLYLLIDLTTITSSSHSYLYHAAFSRQPARRTA